MRVKLFTAATMQEAMGQIKSELGIDAVILHTRRFRKGGFLGYWGKEMVEVTAAVDDAPKPAVVQPLAEPIVPRGVVKKYQSTSPFVSEDEIKENEDKNNAPEAMITRRTNEIEKEKMENLENKQKNQQEEKILQLQQEIDHMKSMLEKVSGEIPENTVATVTLLDALLENEVSEKVAQAMIDGILDEGVLKNKDLPEAVTYLADYFDQAIKPPVGIEINEGETKIVALIGATGVGKTTTIAKIAANFVLEKGFSVALITADTYRISAVEQLKTYSDIMGLPLEIVYSSAELKIAIDKHRDKQLILIDTAGRSQHNEFQIMELRDLLMAQADIEKYLVLSATTKYKDLVDLVKIFSICIPDKVLFTKVDETSSIGVIVNLLHQYPLTLSYLSNGQSVPDDLIVADSHKLAELILR